MSYDTNTAKNAFPNNTQGHVRAFIKIQSGCDFHCTFCVTRVLRGKSKQINPAAIIKRINASEKNGCQEIVLTGTNILLYKNIYALIKKVLKETPVPRIRFGSIDPRLVTDKFIALFKNPRLQPHLHLSIQSGSQKILEKMGRPVNIRKTEAIVKKLRAVNPLFNFSADIIVGYPDETNEDFKKSLNLVKKLRLSKIHYFPYSVRPGTPALNLPSIIITKRLKQISDLDRKLQKTARERIFGKRLTILFEGAKKYIHYGYTPNFIRIGCRSKIDLTGKIKDFII